MSRGNAVESMIKSIMNSAKDPANYSKLLQTGAMEYTKGNIAVVPKDIFLKVIVSNGINIFV